MSERDDFVIRPATRADVHSFTGGLWPYAGHIWAADYKDELVAVAGVIKSGEEMLAFSTLDDDIPVPKRVMWLGAKELWANIKGVSCGKMVRAIADRHTSPVLLSHLGFVQQQGDEWTWASQ